MAFQWFKVLTFISCYFLIPENTFWINAVPKRVIIQDGSKIYLEGTTNVNTFRCHCEDYFEPKYLEVAIEPSRYIYQKAHLKITAKKLNCHNEKMNRDMYAALKSDIHPAIQIELLDNWYDTNKSATMNTWFDIKARIKLTITHVTKEMYIQGKVKRTSANSFELHGKKDILLTDFGITPPQAMLGMIKVNDQISLSFFLKIQTDNINK